MIWFQVKGKGWMAAGPFTASGCAVSVLRMNLVPHPGMETADFKKLLCFSELMYLISRILIA